MNSLGKVRKLFKLGFELCLTILSGCHRDQIIGENKLMNVLFLDAQR